MTNGLTRTALAIALLVVGCSRKPESLLDRDFIREDLDKRSVSDLYEQAGSANYTPPADGCLTKEQITGYVKFAQLTLAIEDVARTRVEKHLDDAAQSQGRLDRIGAGAGALGSFREAATADLRAAVLLEVNLAEQRWVETKILNAIKTLNEIDRLDARIADARRELDRCVTETAAERWRMELNSCNRQRESFVRDQPGMADAKLVRENAPALSRYFATLR